MNAIKIVFILAVIVEALIEYFGSPIPSKYKIYTAALVGITLCLLYGADLLGHLGYSARLPYVGEVLTGLLIARGANYFNSFAEALLTLGKPSTRATDTIIMVQPNQEDHHDLSS